MNGNEFYGKWRGKQHMAKQAEFTTMATLT